jgi:alpha-aminoadipic semialdehyde synthase
MYWDSKYPKLITDSQIANLVKRGENKLIGVCDITCDLEGSIEFCKQFTNVEHPYYTYNPLTKECTQGIHQTGILYESLDYLPAMLPYDASMHFGSLLI